MTTPARTDLETLQYVATRFGATHRAWTAFLQELDPHMVSAHILEPLNNVGSDLLEVAQAIASEARHYGYEGPDIIKPGSPPEPEPGTGESDTSEAAEAHWTRWFKLRDAVVLLSLRNAEVFYESAPDGMSEEQYDAMRGTIHDELELAVREWAMHMLTPVPE